MSEFCKTGFRTGSTFSRPIVLLTLLPLLPFSRVYTMQVVSLESCRGCALTFYASRITEVATRFKVKPVEVSVT
jgi:hypothetical protein